MPITAPMVAHFAAARAVFIDAFGMSACPMFSECATLEKDELFALAFGSVVEALAGRLSEVCSSPCSPLIDSNGDQL